MAGTAILFAQYGHFVICTDFFSQQIPFIMEAKRMLASGTPFWSWNTYFGDNYFGGATFYTLTSPFVWLNCLFPYRWMLDGIFVTLLLKHICAFLTARYYFRTMRVSALAASIGGLLYTFSSYAVSNTYYYHFFEPMIAFPLLLVAVERYLHRRPYCEVTLALGVFLTLFVNFFFAVGSLITAVIYTFFRAFIAKETRQSPSRMARGVLAALLGVALAAVVLLPTAAHLAGSPRIVRMSGLDRTAPWFFLERIKAILVPQLIEQPTALFRYSGFDSCSLCLPVVGALLTAISCRRMPKSWLTWLIITLLLVYLTPLNTGMTLFTCPSYVRWGYALALIMILPVLRFLEQPTPHLPLRTVGFYGFACFGVLAIAATLGLASGGSPISQESPSLLLVGYAVVLGVSIASLAAFAFRGRRSTLVAGIALTAAVQMAASCFFHSEIYFRHQGIAYVGMPQRYVIDCPLPRVEGDMHSRTAFSNSTFPFFNQPMLYNRPGVQSFHSEQNTVSQRVFSLADPKDGSRVAFTPCINVRSFNALMSVSGLVALDGEMTTVKADSLAMRHPCRKGGYTEYRCDDFIPMGFTYDHYVTESHVERLLHHTPCPDVPLLLLSAMAVPDTATSRFRAYLAPLDTTQALSLDSLAAQRRSVSSRHFNGTTRGFTADINLPRDNYVFFSVPADGGFTAYIDGQKASIEKVNLGMAAVLVPRGAHHIRFSFIPRGFRTGAAISLTALLLLLVIRGNTLCHKH